MDKYNQVKRILDLGIPWNIVATGESMYPTFISPQRLVIQKSIYKVGDCVFAYSPRLAYRVHRIVKKEGDRYRLKGDGSIFFEECLGKDQILGVVIGFYHRNKKRMYKRNRLYYSLSHIMITFSMLKCLVPHVKVQQSKIIGVVSRFYTFCCDIILLLFKMLQVLLCSYFDSSETKINKKEGYS